MKDYFDFAGRGTGYRQETLAGATTFLTMAYIIIVNPAILEAAGIPGTLHGGDDPLRGVRHRGDGTVRQAPFAIAPYMGRTLSSRIPSSRSWGSLADGVGAVFIAASCSRC
jgi:AGZA family xanthine/uracil permease-like MFS transporter